MSFKEIFYELYIAFALFKKHMLRVCIILKLLFGYQTFFFFPSKKNFFFFVFLGPHPRHMEVPRLGVESELQLLAYTTATAMPDP